MAQSGKTEEFSVSVDCPSGLIYNDKKLICEEPPKKLDVLNNPPKFKSELASQYEVTINAESLSKGNNIIISSPEITDDENDPVNAQFSEIKETFFKAKYSQDKKTIEFKID